ncbi:metal ABC transporter solute-binding protein, Zn/Mn family [Domibacillus epiphyticus]|uniref:Adhesin n=1 Tax=Domibacillus epiphyticus TaxID=1714355 RepID=A0A1V2A7I1_9BACI|nr:zinc ABC transporter substrate-binding protein [Domibacillus epiphyticus]OMP66926.1 adhesin [Domibacillus epiphyticus]
MKKWAVIAASLSLFLAACGNKEEKEPQITDAQNNKLTVYTTIYPLEYFAERIGGSTVSVESIMPSGADAHTFEPTSKTMLDLAQADLFFYNGLNLEPFAEKAEATLAEEDTKIVNVGEHVNLEASNHEGHSHDEEADSGDVHKDSYEMEQLEESEHAHEEEHGHEEASEDDHNHSGVDPHIWIDPMLAVEMANVVKNELAKLNPDEKETYNENYEKLKEDLTALDGDFHTMIDSAGQKEILVSHAAYGYWEESYGIEQISVAGLSPTDEPSQKELKEIADTAKKHGIKYVIFEQNITPKVAEVIQNEIGADSLRLHNLASLTDEDQKNGDDYLSIMKNNIETLKTAMIK